MKIVIVGAGIGGLSAYLALRKHLPNAPVIVYESYRPTSKTSSSTIGGGLGLASNGQRALYQISPAVVDRIRESGFQCANFVFRNSAGTKLGKFVNGSKERYGFDQVLLSRAAVHDALLAEVDKLRGGHEEGDIHWGRRVLRVAECDGSVELEFEDGMKETADLVIGADGVRSVVRECVAEGRQRGRSKKDGFKAVYQGLTGTGGFLPLSDLPSNIRHGLEREPVSMTFGPDGFFGYSMATPTDAPSPRVMWWSTYETATVPHRSVPLRELRAQLLERHSTWKSPHDTPGCPFYKKIIDIACGPEAEDQPNAMAADRNLLILPVYVMPRLQWWTLSSGRVFLLGDSAHAMPPDSGQGVSCAVEDSLALSLLLEHHLSQAGVEDAEALVTTAKDYEAIRLPRVAKILDVAQKKGKHKRKQSWWEEWIRDWILWFLCKLPEAWVGDYQFAYDAEAEVRKRLAAT